MRVVPTAAGGVVRVMGVVTVVGMMPRRSSDRVVIRQGKEWRLSSARGIAGALRDRCLRPADAQAGIRDLGAGALGKDCGQSDSEGYEYWPLLHRRRLYPYQ